MKKIIPVVVKETPVCPECGQSISVMHGNDVPVVGDWNLCANVLANGSMCLAVLRIAEVGERVRCVAATPEELQRDAANMEEKSVDLLRMAFAERAKRKGVSS